MIYDSAKHPVQKWDTDICVIGSGIVGLAFTNALLNSDKRILILEKGGDKLVEEKTELKDCIISGHHFTGHLDGRTQVFGGTSHTWGGQALPLEPSDIASRPWVGLDAWPLSYDELAPHFAGVNDFLNISQVDFNTPIHHLRAGSAIELGDVGLKYHFSKWSRQPNISTVMRNRIRNHKRISVLENATVVQILLNNEFSSATRVLYKNAHGVTGEVSARQFIVCSGGIENARILLQSNTQMARGIGNAHGNVGVYFQDHPTAQVATVVPKNEFALQRHFNYFFHKGTRCLPRLSLSLESQMQHRTGSATAFIQFISSDDSLFATLREVARSLRRRRNPGKRLLMNCIQRAGQVTDFPRTLREFVFNNRLYTPQSTPRLTMMLEQVPDHKSKIALSTETDEQGLHKVEINWSVSDKTADTFRTFKRVLDQAFTQKNVGHIQWDSWTAGDNKMILSHFGDAFHHMGTTRMSTDPKDGVVDSTCRVHGIQNLYVLGSSVYSTTGHSNPTYMAIALALRCAEHLKALESQN